MKTYSVTTGKKFALLLFVGFAFLTGLRAENRPNVEFAFAEERVEVEAWMNNLEEWELHSIFKEDQESEPEIEAWMLVADDANWNLALKVESEEEIEIEEWMSDLTQW